MRLALLFLCATPALAKGPIAEVICVPRPELERKLSGATVSAAGLRDSETVLEIWTRPSGDRTLVQSYADGIACILAMGEAWEAMVPPPA
ncbi:hypothetical protein [Rhodobacter calidifons]|uniref:Uncharacterized protein n=1 Tax=Rhodobacter calidifons TaxID=2715277 RepID=A0ABX0G701_9RHOB|nr:hypothetical protein [Rhodobacter calidifons]NHB77004.1 hypothetical protein [Rhodobacter calidifons]